MNAMEVGADPHAPLFLRIFTVAPLKERATAQTKTSLRAACRAFRLQLDAEEYGRRSEQIVSRLQGLDEVSGARSVHVFWPMLERREVDLRPLIAWLYAQKKQIVLPVVVAGDASNDERLEHRLFSSEEALVRSRLGIHEPLYAEVAPDDRFDVVIAPALGVDRTGNRLGYGRGHYDRFLNDVRAPIVVPVFQECVVDEIPVETHDVPVDILVTETEVLRTSARNHSQNRAV
jgi:5-formyltetrahydrofolate cyclo-ligase